MANIVFLGGSNNSGDHSYDVVYYNYTNTSSTTIGTRAIKLYRQSFEVTGLTNVGVWFECKLFSNFTEPSQTLSYEYYLDGVRFDYFPQDTYGVSGYYTPFHMYTLTNLAAGMHYWEVRVSATSGEVIVNVGDLHAQIYGQNLNPTPGFDGNIEVYDEYAPLVGGQNIAGLSDVIVSIDTNSPYPNIQLEDEYTPLVGGQSIVTLSESISITKEKEHFNLVTEDGDNLATEDGDTLIT